MAAPEALPTALPLGRIDAVDAALGLVAVDVCEPVAVDVDTPILVIVVFAKDVRVPSITTPFEAAEMVWLALVMAAPPTVSVFDPSNTTLLDDPELRAAV